MKRIFFTLLGLLVFLQVSWAETELIPRIHFESNRCELDAQAVEEIQNNVDWLKSNPEAVMILEGHADEWGDENYNLQLGDLRAREVKDRLIQEGVDPERVIMVVSLGESRPLDIRKINEAWAMNRRVEFMLR